MSSTKQAQALLQELQQKTQSYLRLYNVHSQHMDANDAKQMQQIRVLAERLDTVIGYDEMATDEAGNRTKFTFAQEVLGQNKEFVALMQQFANPDVTESDNFGATEKGEFGDILLEFETLTGDEILKKYMGVTNGIAFRGAVISQIRINGQWLLAENFKGSREDIQDLNKDLRILAVFNTDKSPTLDASIVDPILLISHEITVHAKSAAQRIKAFKDGKNNLQEWQAAIVDATEENEAHFGKEHQEIENGTNATYEAINDETYRVLNDQYNDHKIKQSPVYPAWDDKAGQPKVKVKEGEKLEPVLEPVDEIFNKLRQSERLDYVSPSEKDRTTDFIQDKELPRIEKMNTKK